LAHKKVYIIELLTHMKAYIIGSKKVYIIGSYARRSACTSRFSLTSPGL